MISFYPAASTVRMGASTPQRQKTDLRQSMQSQLLTPQVQRPVMALPVLQQTVNQGLSQVQSAKEWNNPINQVLATSRALSNSANTIKSNLKGPQANVLTSVLQQQAHQGQLMAKAQMTAKHNNNTQVLKARNDIDLRMMMMDLAHPIPSIAQGAAQRLKKMGLSQEQINALSTKAQEQKKNSELKFSGKSLEQLMDEAINVIEEKNSPQEICQLTAQHYLDTAEALQQEIRFSGVGPTTLVSLDLWYDIQKQERNKEFMQREMDRIQAKNDRIAYQRDSALVQKQIDALNPSSTPSQANSSQTSFNSTFNEFSEISKGDLESALRSSHGGFFESAPPIYTWPQRLDVPSQLEYNPKWLDQQGSGAKPAFFINQWNSMPELHKNILIQNPILFPKYFPNFKADFQKLECHYPNFNNVFYNILHNNPSSFPQFFKNCLYQNPTFQLNQFEHDAKLAPGYNMSEEGIKYFKDHPEEIELNNPYHRPGLTKEYKSLMKKSWEDFMAQFDKDVWTEYCNNQYGHETHGSNYYQQIDSLYESLVHNQHQSPQQYNSFQDFLI